MTFAYIAAAWLNVSPLLHGATPRFEISSTDDQFLQPTRGIYYSLKPLGHPFSVVGDVRSPLQPHSRDTFFTLRVALRNHRRPATPNLVLKRALLPRSFPLFLLPTPINTYRSRVRADHAALARSASSPSLWGESSDLGPQCLSTPQSFSILHWLAS